MENPRNRPNLTLVVQFQRHSEKFRHLIQTDRQDDEYSATTSPKIPDLEEALKQLATASMTQTLAAPNADTGLQPVPLPSKVDPNWTAVQYMASSIGWILFRS